MDLLWLQWNESRPRPLLICLCMTLLVRVALGVRLQAYRTTSANSQRYHNCLIPKQTLEIAQHMR